MLSASPASSRHPQYSEVADVRVTSREGTRWVSGLQSSSPLRVDPHSPRVPRASRLQHPLPLQQTPQSQEERPRLSSVRLSSTLAEPLLCPRHCAGPWGHTSELLNTLEQGSAIRRAGAKTEVGLDTAGTARQGWSLPSPAQLPGGELASLGWQQIQGFRGGGCLQVGPRAWAMAQ